MQGRGIHTLSNILRTCGPRYRESVSWGGRVAVRTRGQARGRALPNLLYDLRLAEEVSVKCRATCRGGRNSKWVFVMYVRWPLVPHSKVGEGRSFEGATI